MELITLTPLVKRRRLIVDPRWQLPLSFGAAAMVLAVGLIGSPTLSVSLFGRSSAVSSAEAEQAYAVAEADVAFNEVQLGQDFGGDGVPGEYSIHSTGKVQGLQRAVDIAV